jgi:hypothetical protein
VQKLKGIELEMIVLSVNEETLKILTWIFVLKMRMSIGSESKGKRCYFGGIEVIKLIF